MHNESEFMRLSHYILLFSCFFTCLHATMVLKPMAMLHIPYARSDILAFVGDPVMPLLYAGINTGEISMYNISNPTKIRHARTIDAKLLWDQPNAGNVLSGMVIHPNPTRINGVAAFMRDGNDIWSMRSLFSRNFNVKKCIDGPEKTGTAADFSQEVPPAAKQLQNAYPSLDKNYVPLEGVNATYVPLIAELSDVYFKSYLSQANGWMYYVDNVDATLNRVHGWARKNPYCRERRLKSLKHLISANSAAEPIQSILVNDLNDVIYVFDQTGLLTCLTGHPYSIHSFNNYIDYNAYDTIGSYDKMVGQRILQSYVNPRANMLYVVTQTMDNSYNLFFLDITFPNLIYERAVWNFGPLELYDMTFQNIISDFVAVGAGNAHGGSYIFLFNKFIYLSTLSVIVKPERMICSMYDQCLYVQGTLKNLSVVTKYCGCDTGNGEVYAPGKTPDQFVYDPSVITKKLFGRHEQPIKAWHRGCV